MKRPTFAAGAAALLLAASLAHAHSELTSSFPADKATLATAPKELTLHFSEPVRLTAVAVTSSGGAKNDLAGLPSERMKDFTVAAPGLGDGQYNVEWRALSEDGHVMTGNLKFYVGSGPADHSQHGANHQPAAEHGEHPH